MWKQAASQLDCISFTRSFLRWTSELTRVSAEPYGPAPSWRPLNSLPAHDYTLSFLISRPCPTPRGKGEQTHLFRVARGYLPVPELENTPLTGNVKYILRNVYIIQILQVPVTFHCRGTPLPHASTRPLRGALTNTVNNKLTCLRADVSYFFCCTRKRDVCVTPSLIVFQRPAGRVFYFA